MTTTDRDQRIMEEHHEIAGGRIAEAARDTTSDPTAPATPGELDLDAITARANAATPGPWHEQHIGTDVCVHIGDYGFVCAGPRAPEYDMDSEQGRDDAEFIAHARTDVPALVAEVRRLRGELHTARATEPTTYALPAEPPAHVRRLWGHGTDNWIERTTDGWRVEADEDGEYPTVSWIAVLLAQRRLSTTPPAGTEPDAVTAPLATGPERVADHCLGCNRPMVRRNGRLEHRDGDPRRCAPPAGTEAQ